MSRIINRNSAGKTQAMSDRLAVALSALCILHCIVTPLLLLTAPSLVAYSILSGETLHYSLLFLILPVGLFALCLGFLHHKRKWILGVGITGLLLLSSPILFESSLISSLQIDLPPLRENDEMYITIIASIFVIIAHTANYRLRQFNTSFVKA